MSTALAIAPAPVLYPDPNDLFWQSLPAGERDRVRLWLTHLDNVRRAPRGKINQAARAAAGALAASVASVLNKLTAWKREGWIALVDKRKLDCKPEPTGTADPAFQAHLKTLLEDNQRCSRAALRQLFRDWRDRKPIPGYDGHPGWPALPKGWSLRNLYRVAPDKVSLKLVRDGVTSVAAELPQIFTTRVGLYPGSHFVFDDLWHDVNVRWGNTVTRVLQLAVQDVFSACLFDHGTKPRVPKEAMPGRVSHEGIKEANMRFFLAGILYNHGFSPRGTILMAEHGTAAISERCEQIIHEATKGLVTVRRSTMTGEEQALLQGWTGRCGGNPRFKASLESLHNLIHNELAALPGPTGHDRDEPETTFGIVSYQKWLLKESAKLPERLLNALRHPLLDYSTEFVPLLRETYDRIINARTDHKLEGWEACGHVTTDYRLSPASAEWISGDHYLALPDATRSMLSTLVQSDPATWSRRRYLSPAEVWARRDLQPIGMHTVCDIIGPDLAREVKVTGSYIEIGACEINPEPLIYEARVYTLDNRVVELHTGQKVMAFVNPFFPARLVICDAALRCIGVACLYKRIARSDFDDSAFGHKKARVAARLQDIRHRRADEETSIVLARDHNSRLIKGEPVLPEDVADARADAAHRGQSTRRSNASDTDDSHWDPEPVAAAPSSWADACAPDTGDDDDDF
jgi:hypothetical protein